jgi:hypothetical protein
MIDKKRLTEAIDNCQRALYENPELPITTPGHFINVDSNDLIVLLEAIRGLAFENAAWRIAAELIDKQPPGLTLRELLGETD